MSDAGSMIGRAPLQKLPELDGIRGMAILLIIVMHFSTYEPKHISAANVGFLFFTRIGWTGVDLFFVLSGFLITRILLSTKHSTHYFKSFYIRRALRILPIYYLAVFLFFDCLLPLTHMTSPPLLASVLGPNPPGGLEQLWYWFHVSNWQSAWGPYAYSPIGHFWSLAIEEQFYFVWPLVVLLCSESSLMSVCTVLIFVSAGLRYLPVFQAIQVTHTEYIYRLTPFRVEPLLFGAILAIAEAKRLLRDTARLWGPLLFTIGCIGVAGAVFLAKSARNNSVPMSTFGFSAISITCFSVVLYGIRNTGSARLGSRILRSSLLTQCGKYSYAMYIFNTPLHYLVSRTLFRFVPYSDGAVASTFSVLLGIGLSYAAARCSWVLIEQRFLRLKDRFPPD